MFLQESSRDGDPPAASPLSVFEKGNFTEGYFPVILFNYYHIVLITSSLGSYDNSWHVKSLRYEMHLLRAIVMGFLYKAGVMPGFFYQK